VIPFYVQGDSCIGDEGGYLGGYLAAYYSKTYIDSGAPDTWMTGTYQCADMLIKSFDHHSKTGLVNISQIQQGKLPSKFRNISELVNNARIPSILGGNYTLDPNGDLNMDLSIKIYYRNKTASFFQPLSSVIVGKWSYATDQVTIFDESKIFFNGNATAPPKPSGPKTIPVVPYTYKEFVRILFDTLALICVTCCFGLIIFTLRYRTIREMKSSSPSFLVCILVGAIISFAGIFVLSIYPTVRFFLSPLYSRI
jgi:hypothetical protein